jgi:lambda family phage portal protein
MNVIDRVVATFSPTKGVARAKARLMLARYEATQPGRQVKNPTELRDAISTTLGAAKTLRGQARHLDENYDYVSGALDVLVRNTVGATGINVIPLPRDIDGTINKELAREFRRLWANFSENPEVTKQLNWATANQLMARSLFRDGEVFSKAIIGKVSGLDHRSIVQLSLELLEADYCPDDYNGTAITQGIQFNQWSQPVGFWFTDNHPGGTAYASKIRRIGADRVDHLKMTKRLNQARGVTPLASAINRINNLAEYEHNEQLAAAIASQFATYIKSGGPDDWAPPVDDQGNPVNIERNISLSGGSMVELMPGEEIGSVESNRPSGLLSDYVRFMMKGVAAAVGTSYSSTSKDYDGTYSSQRQELVEQTENYKLLTNIIVSKWVRPVWRRFVDLAVLEIDPKLWVGIDELNLYDAAFMGPQMPWIDPKKEADAFTQLVALNVASPQEIIHKRGLNPQDVLDQIAEWQLELDARGIKNPTAPEATETDVEDEEEQPTPEPNEDK